MRGSQMVVAWVFMGLFLVVIVGGVILARRHMRQGRGDWRGGKQVGIAVFGMHLTGWLLLAYHSWQLSDFRIFLKGLSGSMLAGGMVMVVYLALEPYARRHWHNSLISWNRLLSGRVGDALVRAHVLAAVAWGVAYALALAVLRIVDVRGGGLPAVTRLETLTGFGEWAGAVVTSLYSTVFVGLGITFLLLLLRVALKKQTLANAVMVGLVTFSTAAQSSNLALSIVAGVVVAQGMVIMLTRFGMLPMCVGVLVVGVVESFPPVLMTGEWYFPYSMLTVGLLAGLTLYTVRVNLRGAGTQRL